MDNALFLEDIRSDYKRQLLTTTKKQSQLETLIESDISTIDEPIVQEIKATRAEVLLKLKEQLPLASFSDLTKGLKTLTEISQLLQGKSTQNISVKAGLVMLTKEQLDEVNSRFN
jgi:hypothetical protein